MKEKYTIGLDFGTLSGRGVLVRCRDGEVVSSAVKAYKHGVLETFLPDGKTALPSEWCLQHPEDYLEVVESVIPDLLLGSDVDAEAIIGLGVDFTASTILPVDSKGIPLCEQERFKLRRNAYAKLWKHHGAQRQADYINGLLVKMGLAKTPRFGGTVSSELMVPKVLETLQEDLEVYESASEFLEAGDWITRTLTGSNKRSCSMAGYKMWWSHESGYLENGFFGRIDNRLEQFVAEKLPGEVVGISESVGGLSKVWSEKLGLREGIAVAPAIIDSHAGFPGSRVYRKGQAMLVIGTSSVLMTLSDQPYSDKGIYGGVRDAIVPGYYALESGLAAVGDLFGWFIEKFIPECYCREAEEKNLNIHTLLSLKAQSLKAGESGLMALDWWNGNKTPYVDSNLSGSIVGLTLSSKPEEIYRALIEATAFGTRTILELFKSNGLQIDEIIASGGIAIKNPLLMQIYADVLGVDIRIAESEQAAALGASIYASLAAKSEAGGYDIYREAVENMTKVERQVYFPEKSNAQIYDDLYKIYQSYSDIMGNQNRRVIEELYKIKNSVCCN